VSYAEASTKLPAAHPLFLVFQPGAPPAIHRLIGPTVRAKIALWIHRWAGLEHEDLHTALCKFLCGHAAGRARSDDDSVVNLLLCHFYLRLRGRKLAIRAPRRRARNYHSERAKGKAREQTSPFALFRFLQYDASRLGSDRVRAFAGEGMVQLRRTRWSLP
jgi:hypothetical protein